MWRTNDGQISFIMGLSSTKESEGKTKKTKKKKKKRGDRCKTTQSLTGKHAGIGEEPWYPEAMSPHTRHSLLGMALIMYSHLIGESSATTPEHSS
ncbi:hypothetical protein EYF80_007161 [Liparis tanakae]|uniref:Uncharacterized protein n=1 Tax=Liparis tanakae TaxID=230148 RepID=A0A4Z2IZK8_9TELE|nr:hypothetical protein EYF80_007161 [Liparis tanakae]